MPDASVIEVVDALVSAVNTSWAPSAPSAVSRVWIAPVSVAELHRLEGRQVYFFAGPYENSPDTRGESRWGYRVGAICVDRYEDAGNVASSAVKTWVDGLVYFVESELVDALDYGVQSPFLQVSAREIWTETIEVVRLYDPDMLAEKKVFLSEIAYQFREVR